MYAGDTFSVQKVKKMKKEVDMEQTQKKIFLLKRVRWICLLLGIIMFIGTRDAFGFGWAAALSTVSAAAFYLICGGEVKRTICQYVADDLKDAVASVEMCIRDSP